MNTTLSKFMSIAITALVIASLVFVVLTGTVKTETNAYNANVTSQQAPVISTATTP